MALFEGYERRIDGINTVLKKYGMNSIEDAKKVCDEKGINVYDIVRSIQPICFENACWAYTLGAAIAIKNWMYKRIRCCKEYWRRTSSFLYSRICCRRQKSWSWTR